MATRAQPGRMPITSHLREITLLTDTSLEGWEAVLGSTTFSGTWTAGERKKHINWLELLAVHRAMEGPILKLQGHIVNVLSDNRIVIAYLQKQGHQVKTVLWESI